MNKKTALFYTFLFFFIASGSIALAGVLNWIQIKEGYLDKLFYLTISGVAGSLVSLFKGARFFEEDQPIQKIEPVPQTEYVRRSDSTVAADSTNAVSVASEVKSRQAVEERGPSSAESYFKTLDKLSHRFAEQAEYLKRIKGKPIKWTGIVSSVSDYEDGGASITLRENNIFGSETYFVKVPEECKARALALHPGDTISFQALMEVGCPPAPHFKADTFELLSD